MAVETQIPLTRLEAAQRHGLIRNPDYKVHFSLDSGDAAPTFEVRANVTFDATPGTSTFINAAAESIDTIILNGKTLDVSVFTDGRIPLENLAEHNTLEVV